MTTLLSLDELIIEAKSLADTLQHCNGFNGVEISDDDLIKIIICYTKLSYIDSDVLTHIVSTIDNELPNKLKVLYDYLNRCSNSLNSVRKRFHEQTHRGNLQIQELAFQKVSVILLYEYAYKNIKSLNNSIITDLLHSRLRGFAEVLFEKIGANFSDDNSEILYKQICSFSIAELKQTLLILRYGISIISEHIEDKDKFQSLNLIGFQINIEPQLFSLRLCADLYDLLNGTLLTTCRELSFCKALNNEKIKKSEKFRVRQGRGYKTAMYYIIYYLASLIDEIDKKKEWREKFMEEVGLNSGTYQSHVNGAVARIDEKFEEIWEELEDEIEGGLEDNTLSQTKNDIEEANEKHIDIILYRIRKIILDNKKSRNKIKR